MASLSVRKLDDAVYEKLRVRAAQHGVSMEEEVRQILGQVVQTPLKVSEVFTKYFGLNNAVDLQLDQHLPHDPLDLAE